MVTKLDVTKAVEELGVAQGDILLVDMKAFCDACYEELEANPEQWCNEATLAWLEECRKEF